MSSAHSVRLDDGAGTLGYSGVLWVLWGTLGGADLVRLDDGAGRERDGLAVLEEPKHRPLRHLPVDRRKRDFRWPKREMRPKWELGLSGNRPKRERA